MARIGFVMKLKPGCEAAYKERHDRICPELARQIRDSGIRNYSIFRHGLLLFAYYETDNPEPGRKHGSREVSDLTRQWWKSMEPLMEYNPDGTPWRQDIEEVFHID